MNGFAYVSFIARRSNKPQDIGLMVVDARQPAAPELAFELPFEEVYGEVVAAQDNYLYIRTVVGTIEIWDATDPFNLTPTGAYTPPQSRLLPRSKDKEPGFTPPTPRQLAAEKGIGSFMAHKDPELVASNSCTSASINGVAVENGFLYLLVNQGGSFTTVCEDGGCGLSTSAVWKSRCRSHFYLRRNSASTFGMATTMFRRGKYNHHFLEYWRFRATFT